MNDFLTRYLNSRPNTLFGQMLRQRAGLGGGNPAMAGSNNAENNNSPTPAQGNYFLGRVPTRLTPTQPYTSFNSPAGLSFNQQMPGANNSAVEESPSIPSFAEGGLMMNGEAVRPGQPMQPGQPQQQLSPKDIEAQAAQLVNANREATEKVRALIQYALDTGELTPDELNMMIQLAKVAASNPASYPQVRQFAIQNGLGTEAEIPAQYDQGLILLIIAVGKTLQSGQGNMLAGQPPPQGQAPQTQGGLPSYSRGGMTGDQAHVAVVHDNEYVIPKEALLYHGKKTFDKLVEQARGGEV